MRRLCFTIITLFFLYGCTFSGMVKFSEGLESNQSEESKVILYSIEPYALGGNSQTFMYSYPVLGSMRLDHNEASKLIEILSKGVWNWRWKNVIFRSETACFNPRHIVRVEAGNDAFDYVICFECSGIEVYKNGVPHSYAGILAEQKEFDDALVGGGVPLAKH